MLCVDSALEKGAQQVGRIKAFLFIQQCASVGCIVALRLAGLTQFINISFSKSTRHTWKNGKNEIDHQQTLDSPSRCDQGSLLRCHLVPSFVCCAGVIAALILCFPFKHLSVPWHLVIRYTQMSSLTFQQFRDTGLARGPSLLRTPIFNLLFRIP